LTIDKVVTLLGKSEGRSYNAMGALITCKADRETTGGAFSLFEGIELPGNGPPLHIHQKEDEAFYILEGDFKLQVGDHVDTVGAGAFVYFPKGMPHTYKNVGKKPGRFLQFLTPAGYERFLEELDTGSEDGMMDFTDLAAVADQYGIELVGPPIL
jgi:mannose-6-phosphate isomerase-like protein (cupin superfamily)